MGMFDTIEWKDSLPISEEMQKHGLDNSVKWIFQTKDFECVMDHYIVENGELFLQMHRNKRWVEGDPKAKSFMDRLGYITSDGAYLEKYGTTETIRIYDFKQSDNAAYDYWIEFKVVFLQGKVFEVVLEKFEARDNAERKEMWQRHMEASARARKIWYNRFIFHTHLYRAFAMKINKFLHTTADFLYRISYKL